MLRSKSYGASSFVLGLAHHARVVGLHKNVVLKVVVKNPVMAQSRLVLSEKRTFKKHV